jgi:hypothetical protein
MDAAPSPELERPPLDEQRKALAGAWQARAVALGEAAVQWETAAAGWTSEGLPAQDLLQKLSAEELRGLGEKAWTEAVLAQAGNVAIAWRWNKLRNEYDCHLGNGLIFEAVPNGKAGA